jgi:hypothetical protein
MSGERKHTPGPWKVAPSIEGDFLGIFPDTGKMELPIAKFSDIVRAEINAANGRLIAAAPDMLAALKAAVEISDRRLDPALGRTGECQAVYDQCAAAISKAEGRK